MFAFDGCRDLAARAAARLTTPCLVRRLDLLARCRL